MRLADTYITDVACCEGGSRKNRSMNAERHPVPITCEPVAESLIILDTCIITLGRFELEQKFARLTPRRLKLRCTPATHHKLFRFIPGRRVLPTCLKHQGASKARHLDNYSMKLRLLDFVASFMVFSLAHPSIVAIEQNFRRQTIPHMRASQSDAAAATDTRRRLSHGYVTESSMQCCKQSGAFLILLNLCFFLFTDSCVIYLCWIAFSRRNLRFG